MRSVLAIGALVVAISVFPLGSLASTPPTYTIGVMDPPVGFTHVNPTHFNATGEVVGNALLLFGEEFVVPRNVTATHIS